MTKKLTRNEIILWAKDVYEKAIAMKSIIDTKTALGEIAAQPLDPEPTEPIEPTCNNCRFWLEAQNGNGYCRRFPPISYLGGTEDINDPSRPYNWDFPITDDIQSCGEFQPKEQP